MRRTVALSKSTSVPGRLSMSRAPAGVYARSCPPSAGDLVRVRLRVRVRVGVGGRVAVRVRVRVRVGVRVRVRVKLGF